MIITVSFKVIECLEFKPLIGIKHKFKIKDPNDLTFISKLNFFGDSSEMRIYSEAVFGFFV